MWLTVSRSSFVVSEKGKMLDPSGCFLDAILGIPALIVLGAEQNSAGRVANAMANKPHFKSTPNLHTLKSYACSPATDL